MIITVCTLSNVDDETFLGAHSRLINQQPFYLAAPE
jgi:hypothetical protein